MSRFSLYFRLPSNRRTSVCWSREGIPVRRISVGAALLIGAALLATDARAGATVDLVFVGRNGTPIALTDTVGALPCDTLTMALLLRNDVRLSLAIFALNDALDGDDELDVMNAIEWAGLPSFGPPEFGPFVPVTPTFVGPFRGQMRSIGGAPLPIAGGLFAGGYQMGT